MPDFFGQIAAFLCSSVPLPVEAGFGCSFSVASNGFVRTKLYLLLLKKNNAPHECGILAARSGLRLS
jgi:hypothetical protein